MLTVADSGSGISDKNANKVYEAFFTTKGAAGNGLGLWISQEIIARHQGSLTVRSRQQSKNSGTVFTLFLPFEVLDS
jgi:signal transduction histidine kinase